MAHQLKLAAREFFRRTLADQRLLDVTRVEAGHEVLWDLPAGTDMIRVKGVMVGADNWEMTDQLHGMELVRAGSAQSFCFTLDNTILMVYPKQTAGVDVSITAALMPSMGSTGISDDLASQYASDIALGAVAALQRMPGQAFSSPQDAQVNQSLFESRVRTVAAKASRGYLPSKRRSKPTFL